MRIKIKHEGTGIYFDEPGLDPLDVELNLESMASELAEDVCRNLENFSHPLGLDLMAELSGDDFDETRKINVGVKMIPLFTPQTVGREKDGILEPLVGIPEKVPVKVDPGA